MKLRRLRPVLLGVITLLWDRRGALVAVLLLYVYCLDCLPIFLLLLICGSPVCITISLVFLLPWSFWYLSLQLTLKQVYVSICYCDWLTWQHYSGCVLIVYVHLFSGLDNLSTIPDVVIPISDSCVKIDTALASSLHFVGTWLFSVGWNLGSQLWAILALKSPHSWKFETFWFHSSFF